MLPKLGNVSNFSATTNGSGSLADFAASSLAKSGAQAETGKKPFVIPNIFSPKPSEPDPKPIDLMATLYSPTEQKKIVKKQPVAKPKPEAENFVPKFIDCDRTTTTASANLSLEDTCELSTLREFKSRSKLRRCKFSIVGRIIATKFKVTRPKIHHSDPGNPDIKRFLFDTPSPDDKILAHLNKAKK